MKKHLVPIPLVLLVAFGVWRGFMYFSEKTAVADISDAQFTLDQHMIDLRLVRAHRQLESIEAWAVKEAAYFMTQAQTRAVIDTIKLNADPAITVDLVMRIIEKESKWNPRAVGKQGERGLMQIKTNIGRLHGATADQLFDPIINVTVGTKELKRLNNIFRSVGLAIAAYAGGPTEAIYYAAKIIGGR